MTVAENAAGAPAPEEPPKQETSQKDAHKKKTWICSNPDCKARIEWLPEKVRHLHPSKILCLKCQKAKKAAEAPADAPPVREAPRHAAPQRRPAGGPPDRRAQAPRALSLEVVELCAFRSGIAPPQVEALLAAIRSHIASPSSDK